MSSCHCIYCTPSLFPVLNYLYKKGVPSLQAKFLIGTGNFRNQKALWLQTYGCVHVHSVYSDFEHKEPSISSVSIQFWTQRAEIRILFTLDSWLLDSTHLERWRREIQKKKTFFGQMPERLLHRPWLSMRASFSACVWVCNCRSQEVGWEPMRLVLVQIGLLGINIEKDTLIWNPTQIVFMLWMGCIQMKFVDNYLNELFILPSKLHEMPNYANYFANAMFLHHPKGQIVHAMNCSNLQWTIKFHMANIVLVKKHWSLWSSFLYL